MSLESWTDNEQTFASALQNQGTMELFHVGTRAPDQNPLARHLERRSLDGGHCVP